jgi:hypothetical protein
VKEGSIKNHSGVGTLIRLTATRGWDKSYPAERIVSTTPRLVRGEFGKETTEDFSWHSGVSDDIKGGGVARA